MEHGAAALLRPVENIAGIRNPGEEELCQRAWPALAVGQARWAGPFPPVTGRSGEGGRFRPNPVTSFGALASPVDPGSGAAIMA